MSDLSEKEIKVLKNIENNREKFFDLFKKLISYKSVTGNEEGIQKFLHQRLNEFEFETNLFEIDINELKHEPLFVEPTKSYQNRPNLIAIYRGSGGGRSLLFNGHVDVIPAEKEDWDFDPWAADTKKNMLYGRGASDMKSGIASMTSAVIALKSAGISTLGDIILQYVVDEESNANGTLSCCLKGYTADAAISCEASDLEIQPAASGSMWFEIEIEGRGTSMSRRWEGVSAIDKACKICAAINEFEQIRIQEVKHSMYPDTRGPAACFSGTLNAGTFASAPPGKAKITGRMGILPGEDYIKCQEEFKAFINSFCSNDHWLANHQPNVKFKGMLALPAEIPENSEVVQIMAGAFKSALKKDPVITGHHGGADTRVLINRFNIPSVIFGPGLISEMHADNEKMNIDYFIPAVSVMAVTIMRWCGVSD